MKIEQKKISKANGWETLKERFDETGRLIRIDGVASDISERKRTEKELEKSFSILEATIESTADGILVVDLNGKIVRFNKKFVELWRIPQEILDTQDDEKAITFVLDQLTNPEEFVSKIKELYVQHKDVSFDILKFKDGRTFERYSQPQLINGNSVGRVWSFRDITERKNAEEALRESEKRLRQIIDLVPYFIFAKDAKGKFILANEAVARAYGCTVEDLIGKSDADFNSKKEEVEHFMQEDLEVINSGNAKYNIEETITDAAGNIRTLSTTKIPYTSPGIDIPGVLGVSVDISERKKVEEALSNNELRFRTLTSNAPVGIFQTNIEGKTIYVNETWLEYTGLTFDEAMGDGWAAIVHPDDRDILLNEWNDKLGKGLASSSEYRLIDKKGNTRWVTGNAVPLFNQSGEIAGYIGTLSDITERKLAIESLQQSENKYRQIVQTAQEGIWMIDKYDYTNFVNKKMCEIIEYSAEELIGQKIYHFMDQESKENALIQIERRKQVINESHDSKFITKSGRLVWVNISTNPVLDEEGIYNGVLAMITDITERKRLEESLEKEKYFLDALMDNMPEAIYFKDKESKLLRVSKFMADRFGVSMDSLIGTSDFDFQDEIHAKEAYEDEQNIKKTGKPKIDYIEKEINEDGSESWVSTTKMPLINARGKVVGTFGISRDITKRKLNEESLKRSEANLEIKNKELEQKNKELEQFAYVASHDMQEPLRTTSSFVELIQKQYKGQLDERADKYLSFIAQSSDRMKVLIKDLLDYSRIGRKKELEEVDCNIMLNEVLADLGTAINETGAEIKTEQLPVVNGYLTEIKQLFQNLIINAIKFREKTIPPQINISVQKISGYWQFAFKDNGIGIAKENNERIFIIFQRLHTRNEYSGSGIGLSHCKKIVELHKGRIWVESAPGEGSTFHFTISQNNR